MNPFLSLHRWRAALIAASLCGFFASAPAITLSGQINSHDPATLTKDGDTWFHFTTGTGIWYSTSRDLTTWTAAPAPVFNAYPSWIYDKIPGFAGSFWAPDVIHLNGHYHLYYSVSEWGKSNSAIGVARSKSLKNPRWTDLGVVVQSHGGADEINAIDPAVFRDVDGRVYLSYGSFFGGIGLVEIDQATAKPKGAATTIFGGHGQDIEAPYILRHRDHYYLFVNRGACCRGAESTYYVQVARATRVTGPYTDTRTVLVNQDGRYKGPGHIGILKDRGCLYASIHYYDLQDEGRAKLDLLKMEFTPDGWPTLTRDFQVASCGGWSDGLYRFTARHSGKALTEDAKPTHVDGQPVTLAVQETYNGTRRQQWYLVGRGDGFHSLINAHSLLSLDVYGNTDAPGAPIAVWPYWGGAGQQWTLGLNDHTLRSRLSGLPLDVKARSVDDGAGVIQWTDTGGLNQQWKAGRLK